MPNLILDNVIMTQSMLERLKSSKKLEAASIAKTLKVKIASVLATIEGNINSRSRSEYIIGLLKKELKSLIDNYSMRLLDDMREIALLLITIEQLSFTQIFSDKEIRLPENEQVFSALENRPLSLKNWNKGLYLPSFISAWSSLALSQISNSVTQTFAQGESINYLSSLLYGNKFGVSVLVKISNDYDSIACTAMQHAQSVACTEFYLANPDLIVGEEFAAILDSSTSVICRTLDGTVYPVGVGPRPPLHFRCRSKTLPIINEKLLSPDSELNNVKSVYGDETYYQWLARQSPKRQDLVLGKTKGKLFRDGGLTSEQFRKLQLHKNFKPMTLDEMRKAVPDAFEKASLN